MDALFLNYRIQSNANNEITLGLTSEALLGALKSAAASSSSAASFDTDEVVMKLAKKNDQALLSFEICGQTRVGHKLRVTHDVKIEVMRPADVAKLKEPLCPEPDVRCYCHAPLLILIYSVAHPFTTSSKTTDHSRTTKAAL